MFDPGTLRLIAITDNLHDGLPGLVSRASAAARGGATMIQLRLKNADSRVLLEVARALVTSLSVPVIVNDRVDVALAAGVAGAHLGADDLPVHAARSIAPPGFIIGASVGCNEEIANSRDADYVGIGPVFGTGTKADAGIAIGAAEFGRLAALCGRPAVAVGGISSENVHGLRAAGAAGVAVVRAVFGSVDAELSAAQLRDAFERD